MAGPQRGVGPPAGPLPPPRETGVSWALVPLWTAGLATPVSFGYAAVRKRSWHLAVSAAAYTGLLALAVTVGMSPAWAALVAVLSVTTSCIGGTIHALSVRRRYYPPMTPNDRALEFARLRRELRQEARHLAAYDPVMALELRIGRPDLPRRYDDGGLVDINHVPPPMLGLLPGLTDDHIERIVRLREEQGRFVSVEELAVHADLPAAVAPALDEYAIFLHQP